MIRSMKHVARPPSAVTAAAWLACMFTCPVLLRAQEKPAEDSPPDATRLDPLTEKQAIIRDRVQRLEDKMFELGKALEKAEPQNAAKLRDALSASRSRQIRQKIEAIVEELGKARYSDALDDQKVVMTDLQQLLKMLLEDANRLDERKKEIERLEAFRKELEKIIEEQRAEKAKAEAAITAAKRAEALDAAAQKAKELLQRQQQATAKSGQAGAESADLSKEQGKIRADTESLTQDVDKLSDAPAGPQDRAGAIPDAGKPDDQPSESGVDKPPAGQEGKPADGQSGSQGKPSPGEKAGGQPQSQSQDSQSGGAAPAAQSLRQAGKSMKSAEDKLEQDQPDAAMPDQQQAERDLQKAIDELEQEARKIRNKLELEKQAEEQKKTADKTRDLGKRMKGEPGGEKGGAKGGQQGGQQGGGQKGGEQKGDQNQQPQDQGDPDQQPTPGQEDVEGAVPYQDDAAKELKDEDPEDAAKEQEEALKKLEQAREQLEDVLEQLRREQQEELLAALEARFRAMLGAQLDVNKGTLRLAELGKANWKRSDQLELAEIAERQRWVGTEADKALKILEEEGTTVVFPHVVEQVRDDALDTGEKLATADTGRQVQLTQQEIEVALRELIEAVKKMQEENQNGGGGGGGGGNDPLLPGSAEFKLLRACQVRVNSWTKEIEIDRLRPDLAAQDIDGRLNKLQKRQQHVDKMARAMRDSLNKAQ